MSWNECAAIGAFLKAQQNAKLQRQQDAQNFAQQAIAFQNAMTNASQRMASLAQFFSANTPAIIARPVNFVLNNIIGSAINTIKIFLHQSPMLFKHLDKSLQIYQIS